MAEGTAVEVALAVKKARKDEVSRLSNKPSGNMSMGRGVGESSLLLRKRTLEISAGSGATYIYD